MKTKIALILLVMFMACTANAVTVTGTVRSSDSKPVPGAKVYAVKSVDEEEPKITAKTISGSDGSFNIGLEPIGMGCQSYLLVAHTEDGYLGWSNYLVWENMKDKDISAEIFGSRVGNYKGKVTDGNGEPLSGVQIKPNWFRIKHSEKSDFMVDIDMLNLLMQFPSVVTDDQGVYVLKNIPDVVDVKVTAEKAGYASNFEITDKCPRDLILVPAGSISGRVIGADGKPIKGLEIHAIGGSFPKAVTAEDGTFKLDPIVPDDYLIFLDSEDLVSAPIEDIKVSAGKNTKLKDMQAVKGVFLSGKVVDVDTGKPIPKVDISLIGPIDLGVTLSNGFETDENGIFKKRVLPGNYTLIVYSPSYVNVSKSGNNNRDTYETVVNVDSKINKEILVKLKKLPVGGGKVIGQNGNPVFDASVYIGMDDIVYTDLNGKFEVPLSSKRETKAKFSYVYIMAEDYCLNMGVVEHINRDDYLKGDVVLQLKPTRTQTIIVKDKAGAPIENAAVWKWRKVYNGSEKETRLATNAAGKVEFQIYEGGTYYFTATHKGYRDYDSSSDGKELAVVGSPNWKNEITIVMDPKSIESTHSDKLED